MGDPYDWREVWDTPRGPLAVGPAAAGDEHDLLRFFRERLGERSNFFLSLHREHTDEDALCALRGRIEGHLERKGLVYVARLDCAIVGFFFLDPFDGVGEKTPSLGIGLADELQGMGLGGRFMDRLIAAAREAGHRAITLIHHPENERAARLYQRKGFVYTGERPTWQTKSGPRTEWRMRLELG